MFKKSPRRLKYEARRRAEIKEHYAARAADLRRRFKKGKSVDEVAADLGIQPRTLRLACKKLGVRVPKPEPAGPDTIGAKVQNLRLGARLTYGQLAMRSHVKTPTLMAIEADEHTPRKTELEGLARALGVSVKQLATRSAVAKRPKRPALTLKEQLARTLQNWFA